MNGGHGIFLYAYNLIISLGATLHKYVNWSVSTWLSTNYRSVITLSGASGLAASYSSNSLIGARVSGRCYSHSNLISSTYDLFFNKRLASFLSLFSSANFSSSVNSFYSDSTGYYYFYISADVFPFYTGAVLAPF